MPEFKQKLEKILGQLKSEISSLRTNRATPALVEDLEVEYYGVKTLLKAIASISNPEPKSLIIEPWDKNALPFIEKAILGSSLGVSPVTDRQCVRITLPPLTEERRKELGKIVGKYTENARIRVRQEREESLRETDRMEKDKKISEDERFRRKKEIQEAVDRINKSIEEISSAKEREIMGGLTQDLRG